MRFLIALLLASTTLSAGGATRVLFIGNSLTYSNDLPSMVSRLGKLDGRDIECVTVARPNYSLGDHLDAGTVRQLARQRWDFVVMQQGPSSLPESRRDLIRDTKRMAEIFKDTQIAMLMVWPAREYAGSWDRVTESYTQAAQAVNGVVIPAGVAIRSATKLPVLDTDGFHPDVAGTYLAALVTYRTITGSLPASVDQLETARKVARGRLPLDERQLKTLVSLARAQ